MDEKSTSTKQSLSSGPADMPSGGGGKPNVQSTSSMIPLSRTPNPVAAFGAKPGMGEVQTSSTKCDLSRNATSPESGKKISKTTPQTSFGGGGL